MATQTPSLTATLPMLHTDSRMPVLGLGVWDSATSVCANTCAMALRQGYRHIDTAQAYGNEDEVRQGIEAAGVPRKDIFVTTKIFSPGGKGASSTYDKCVRSIETLGGYVDLFLIHSPTGGAKVIKEIWQTLEKLKAEGKIGAIGVSNFNQKHLEAMREYAKVWPPAVNQLELHPWMQQREATKYCTENKILLEAYCPLTRMQRTDTPQLVQIAEDVGKSPSQVLIRYCVEKGWVPLPKSDKEHRLRENADIFDFSLSPDQIAILDKREEEDGKLCLCWDVSKL